MDTAAAARADDDDDRKRAQEREEQESAEEEEERAVHTAAAAAAYVALASRLDGDDLVRSIVDDLVDDTTRAAAASVVTNRLVAYIAARLATQLVDAVAPCLVSRSSALEELLTPRLSPNEEPPTTPPLDVRSRHAIAAQSPRAASAPPPKSPSARVIRLGAFAARSLLSGGSGRDARVAVASVIRELVVPSEIQ
ncbi:hypothetical protein PINS_up009746 [Pythium insidiosum]|nr:hypothetical protein PINS_up009746 [Pythium insidiosum]